MNVFRSKLAWSLFAALLVAQFALLAQGVDFIVGRLTNDDTYYYLQSVWNLRHEGFVSFDGIHKTSGVQYLWFLLLYALSWVCVTKDALLLGTLSFCFVLNAACVFPVLAIGRKLDRPFLGYVLALGWVVIVFSSRYWLGLENSLHALVLWMIVAEMVEAVFARPRWTVLGLLWLANVWTRIDGAVFSAAMAAVLLYVDARQAGSLQRAMPQILRAVVPLALIMLPGALLHVAVSWWMGGAVVPVSVIVKTAMGTEYLHGIERAMHRLACDAAPLLPFRFESRTTMACIWFAGVAAFAGTWFVARRSSAYALARPVLIAISALGAGWLVYHAVAWMQNIQYADYCSWHRSSSYILSLLLLASPFALIEEDRSDARQRLFFGFRIAAALTVTAFCLHRYDGLLSFPYEKHIWHIRRQAALWIDQSLPLDARFGAWNAGEVGYFSNRKVINLDGLVNDVDYARNVVIRGDSLVRYLAENKVDYLVDYLDGIYVRNDLQIEKLPVVKNFDRGGGNPLTIWQFIVTPPVQDRDSSGRN